MITIRSGFNEYQSWLAFSKSIADGVTMTDDRRSKRPSELHPSPLLASAKHSSRPSSTLGDWIARKTMLQP